MEVLEKVLEMQTKSKLGDGDLSVATTLGYVGKVLLREGKIHEALENYYRALEIQLKNLEEKHDDAATTYKTIAGIFWDQENYEKVEEMYWKALDILREKSCEKMIQI